MIKAVTLDLWNTLISYGDYASLRIAYLATLLRKEKLDFDREVIRQAYTSVQEHWRLNPLKEYRFVPVKDRVEMILDELDVKVGQDVKLATVRYFEEVLLEDPPTLHEGVKLTLESLYGKYPIGLISDSGLTPGRVLRRVLKLRGILRFFRFTIFSNEVGYNKPSPLIFKQALKLLGVQPKEIIHVGDLPETDIAGAKGMGMLTVWVNRDEEVPIDKSFCPDYQIDQLPELLALLGKLAFSRKTRGVLKSPRMDPKTRIDS